MKTSDPTTVSWCNRRLQWSTNVVGVSFGFLTFTPPGTCNGAGGDLTTLFAYYWLNEDIRPDDSLLVQQTAAVVHQRGRRFVWIPYFHSAGNLQWRRWGFDYAWLQPNYFFHPEVPVTRFDSALTYARTADMGIELEFDPRIFSDWRFMDRLEPYLSAVE